jgi:hypothetical protein
MNRLLSFCSPDAVNTLEIRAAEEVSPYGFKKCTTFLSVESLRQFYLEMWEKADTRCPKPNANEVNKFFILITCDKGGAVRAVIYVG